MMKSFLFTINGFNLQSCKNIDLYSIIYFKPFLSKQTHTDRFVFLHNCLRGWGFFYLIYGVQILLLHGLHQSKTKGSGIDSCAYKSCTDLAMSTGNRSKLKHPINGRGNLAVRYLFRLQVYISNLSEGSGRSSSLN